MKPNKKLIKKFIERWSIPRKERQWAHTFLIELFRDIFGISDFDERLLFEKDVQTDKSHGAIDAYIPETKTLIEMKSSHVDLRKDRNSANKTAFEQARDYYNNLPNNERGRFIVCCNFRSFDIYDMNFPHDEPLRIELENLAGNIGKLEFMINPEYASKKAEKEIKKQQELSIKAGELVGELYNLFLKLYNDQPTKDQSNVLNILIVRLVFCLFAEDAGLFEKNQFRDFLKEYSSANINVGLTTLFEVLNTKEDDRDRNYLSDSLLRFPYVNGGLFSQVIKVPKFTKEIMKNLMESMAEGFDWSKISPTIFGAVFESTLNEETRRSGGMHYTSIENIHKVIDPLFLDDLKAEYEAIENISVAKTRQTKAEQFCEKLSKIRILDPACGSGNFLTESYLCLRKLENKALALQILGDQVPMDTEWIRVHIQQFYGIEINDFAVAVATTALYIAEAQMYEVTKKIITWNEEFLPLRSFTNIHEGDALEIDWNSVVPKEELTYIVGNPPFVGARNMRKDQKEGLLHVMEGFKKSGNLDYVAGWFKKAADMMKGTTIRSAFVSTNSIVQGEQPAILLKPLFEHGLIINFAWLSFVWDSEAPTKAHVHCVIIGFSYQKSKRYFLYGKEKIQVSHINGYLMEGEDIFIESEKVPLCDVPKIGVGNKPIDGGNYLFTEQEMNEFIQKEPKSKQFFHPWYGAYEFINNDPRYCLWLGNCSPSELKSMPEVLKRVKNVKAYRLSSKSPGTQKIANRPTHFHIENMPKGKYIVIPEVSSQRREYIPMGVMDDTVLCSNKVRILADISTCNFGILESKVHMDWMRLMSCRLKSDYSYSVSDVYNTFPWPDPTPQQKEQIKKTAQAILDVRSKYPDASLADLYDPLTMPLDLRKAHEANDRAVMKAYGFKPSMTEQQIVAELMKLYQKLIEDQKKPT